VRFFNDPSEIAQLKKWNFRYAHIISVLRKFRVLSRERIASCAYLSGIQVEQLTEDLMAAGIVRQRADSRLELANHTFWNKTEVIAVEAKLSRWKDALHQAKNYRRFADKSIVALDAGAKINLSRDKVVFRSEGVGLCLTQPNEIRLVVSTGRKSVLQTHEREYLILSAASGSQTLWLRR
jgi:hypothetical protein